MRRGSWTTRLTSGLACGLFAVWLPALVGCPGGDVGGGSSIAGLMVQGVQTGPSCAIPSNESALIQRTLDLINRERTTRGLGELTLNPVLNAMAAGYACEMITGGFFDHENANGEGPGERAIQAGYVFLAIGENLAGGQLTPEQVISEWMRSTQGHRENILASQWREVGIGVRTGGLYGVYWVTEFGNPP